MKLWRRRGKAPEFIGPTRPNDWEQKPPVISVDDMKPAAVGNRRHQAPYEYSYNDGDKFFGGFGFTQILLTDYWTLRQRSAQLFTENLYARGIVRRLVTNEINTGLCLESMPEESILGLPDDSLGDWSEDIETRFGLWGKSHLICDYSQQNTFNSIQYNARLEALVTGDCLVVLRQDRITKLPQVELISGDKVQTPIGTSERLENTNRIRHGVEIDDKNRHIAYHVIDDKGKSTRIAARGVRSGRRVAWLIYGTEKRLDEIRGQPLLAVVLQSLKEIDRYRDAAQRKAVVNSFLAMFITKTKDKQGTMPITGAATRRDQITRDSLGSDNRDRERRYDLAFEIPGLVFEELQEGEEPKAFTGGTDTELGPFEHTILQGIAWALEIPPEILLLSFSSNYSASAAAVNEFKLYQNRIRTNFGENFCQPIYQEWFISQALLGNVEAPGYLEAWRRPGQYHIFAAWLSSDWSGAIKLSTDIRKQAEGYRVMVEQGWITNERASRELTGMKWRKNMRRLKRENDLKRDILAEPEPMPEPDEETGEVIPLRGVENG